jgi:excisionase family DNA binding protein
MREAAKIMGVSKMTVIREIKRGLLKTIRTTRIVRIADEELRRYAQEHSDSVLHCKLPPQNLPGSQQWRKAVAAGNRWRKTREKKRGQGHHS